MSISRRSRRAPTSSDAPKSRGQALAEFAVAAPVVFLVLLGLIDGGRLVFMNNEIAEAAREGARWGSVQGRAYAERAGDNTFVTDETRSRIVMTPGPTVTLSCPLVGAASGDCRSGDVLMIEVKATVRPITPVIGDIIGPLEIVSTAQMAIN